MHARISSPRPAGRSAGNSVRAASASSRKASAGRPTAIDTMPRTLAAVPRTIGSRSSGSARSSSATAWLKRPAIAEETAAATRRSARRCGIGIELGGALQRACGGRVPAAARGVVGGEGQRLGRVVVGRGGGGGAVPRAPVDVGAVVEHGGQRLVRRAALGEARGAVDRRAHERMAEAQPRCPGRSAGRRARRRRGHRARSRDARRPAAASRRRRCRRPPPARAGAARRPERLDADHEGALDALVERQVQAQWRAAGALVIGERRRQLEQGQRVAAGGADEVLAHDRGQGAVEQRARRRRCSGRPASARAAHAHRTAVRRPRARR